MRNSCVKYLCHRAAVGIGCMMLAAVWTTVACAESGAKREPVSPAGLPLTFEANQGQSDNRVKFVARGSGYTLFLTRDAAVLNLRSRRQSSRVPGETPAPLASPPAVLRMRVLGASRSPQISGLDELTGKSNYFIGNDPSKWRTNVPNYAKVRYRDTYPGVDLVYYGNQQQLEYDFIVAPGADPGVVTLDITGEAHGNAPLEIAPNGDLVVPTYGGDVRFRKPVVYQTDERSARHSIDGHWLLKGGSQVGFEVAAYDRRKSLVIDPVLSYSTYLGGSREDSGYNLTTDSSGNAYVVGITTSVNFPTQNPFQSTNQGRDDLFVAKLNPTGSALVFSTYLGGTGVDFGFFVAVDPAGDVYLTGRAGSKDFPTTLGAFQTTNTGHTNAFVTKLNSTGSALVYSTFLGGNSDDQINVIAVGASGDAYVAGWTTSPNFPTTPGAFQTTYGGSTDAFVTELNAAGSALVYSTFLGGGSSDNRAFGIALNTNGDAYVAGWTSSTTFPTTAGAYQTTLHGTTNGFIAELNSTGSALVYSTYLGGSGTDIPWGLALDPSGNACVAGQTTSPDFPTTTGTFQTSCGLGCSVNGAFVSKLNPTGSGLVYSSFLGGSGEQEAYAITVDTAGDVYVTGRTNSTDFPLTPGAFQTANNGYFDAFVTEVNPAGSSLIYSTYIGGSRTETGLGIAVDVSGNAYITGRTASTDFPTTAGSIQTQMVGGANDAFVTKLPLADPAWPQSVSFPTQPVGTSSNPQIITFTNSSTTAVTITGVALTGTNISDFHPTSTCGNSLTAGASCTISMIFKPTASGSRTAAVTITDNAPNNPQTVSLTGVGGGVMLSPSSLTFPVQVVSTSSQAQSVTLTNGGTTPITVNIAVAGPFSQTNSCGLSLPAGGNCTITVTFKPTTKGAQSGSITIIYNASGSPQSVTLTGTGTFIGLAPATLTFGNQKVGTTSSPQAVTVTNHGSATVAFTKILLTGAGAADFAETSTCTATLAAGSSCTISVTFSPKVKATLGVNLTIGDNGGGSPQKVSLTGTGT
jgi:Abnormal spindle-like microcephaly-assoc'd, ASPM-SPD-2-Hydin/Beta-propeller repeat